MSADSTNICNQALGRLGTTRIMNLDDESQPARYCKLFYEETRDEVLREHPWNFARGRATLAKLAESPAFGWAHAFQLPSDCLRVLQLNGFEEHQKPSAWEIEGGRLLTDADEAQITYVKRLEDASIYDALFVEALAVKLAAKLSVPLTGSRSQATQFLKEYESILSGRARRRDAGEGKTKRKLLWVESDLVQKRRTR